MKAIAGMLAGLALIAAGCGSSSSSGSSSTGTSTPATTSPVSTTATVSTAKVAGLGTVLVNSKGHTLYMFAPDKKQRVTCVGSCAALWPPLKLAGAMPTADGQAKSSLLGSDPDPSGGRVVTYAGWPLYTYVPDSKAGEAAGQAVNANGGLWYVLSPSGTMVHTKP
jgi:predicted lipoprotein with Yx(FWY)xxD motif